MKKITTVLLLTAATSAGFAQSSKSKSKDKEKKEYKKEKDDRWEDEDDDRRDDRNDRRDDRNDRRDDRYRNNNPNANYRDGQYHPGRNGRGHAYGHYKNGKAGTSESRDRDYRNSGDRRVNDGTRNSNELPMAVLNAFNRDYPNAKNVQWRSNGRIWTATFETGLFNRDRVASYYRDGREANEDVINRDTRPRL